MIDWNKEAKETDKLISELQRRGIELPKDGSLWFDDLEEQSGTLEEIEASYRHYLIPVNSRIYRRMYDEPGGHFAFPRNRCLNNSACT